MDDVCSLACPAMAGTASVAAMRDASRSLLRWVIVGAASAVLFVLAVMQGISVGAAAPTAYDNTICINYTTCYPTTTTTTTATTGYPPNTVIVAPYFDNRYGVVEVVTDGSGNLIDINPYTGQRIFPFLPDFVGGIGANFIGANFVGGAFLPPGVTNGITCNGVYGCPFGGGFIGNANVNFVNANNCAFFANCAAFPAGGTVVGGVVYYNDNRFCGDGKIAFVPGRGYFCQNGGPLVTNNNATTVNCGNFFFDGCGVFRPFEANTTAPAAPKQATTVTAYSAPAAPQAAAPTARAAAPAATAPTANVATALNAPATPQAAPITAKAQTTSAPSAPGASAGAEKSDDHKG